MSLRKKIIIAFSVLSLVAIAFIFFNVYSGKRAPTEKPSITEGAKYGELQPGVSNINDVTGKLGSAISEKEIDGGKILEYKSSNPNFNNELTIQSDTLAFVKQQVIKDDNISITAINKQYGDYKDVLYGPLSSNGFNLYVIPDKGIAYVGNQLSGTVFEIWYFPPTTFEDFKTKYAEGYSETYQPTQ